MHDNKAKAKLASGQLVSVVAPVFNSPLLAELVTAKGFDVVFIDCEHGSAGWEEVENMVRAAELHGATSVVRVQSNDPSTIARALDRGAGGIQVPHVNSKEEAEAVVRSSKFAPLGTRGFSGGRSAYGEDMGRFAQRANDQSMVIVMLEEVEAIDNLDAILSVDEIDVFFVAPGDLSQSLGYGGVAEHTVVQNTINDTLRRISSARRHSGVLTKPNDVGHYIELGVQFLYVSVPHLLSPGMTQFFTAIK